MRRATSAARRAAAAFASTAFGARALAQDTNERHALGGGTDGLDPHVQYRSLPPASELGRSDAGHFACFDGSGRRCSMEEVLRSAQTCDVVVVGETHDDPVAHQLQLYMLMALQQTRRCVLSLEMFEADVQPVLDEYMAGHIREADMLLDARPWANYAVDYRPLVECAKEAGCPVACANAPRRYVGAVGRDKDGLAQAWSPAARACLPPLPLPSPSAAYMAHCLADPAVVSVEAQAQSGISARAEGGGCPYIGLSRRDGLLPAMRLWDASMAHSIRTSLGAHPGRLVLHVCGSFHAEKRVGIVEMLLRYRPETKVVVVVVYPEDEWTTFDAARHGGAADFVLLSDASLPRSHEFATPAAHGG